MPAGDSINIPKLIAWVTCVSLSFLAISCQKTPTRAKLTGPNSTEGFDFNNDGKDDVHYIYKNGQVSKVKSDLNFDGKFDVTAYYFNGQPEHQEGDYNFDGMEDSWIDFKHGQPEFGRVDTDFNGKPDLFVTYANGIPRESICRPNEQSAITRIYRFYDGILISEAWDANKDGVLDSTNYFDAYGEVVETLSPGIK